MPLSEDRKRLVFWASVSAVWMAVIFAFSAQPHSGDYTERMFGWLNLPVRKLAHMTEFGLLAFFFMKTFESFRTDRGQPLRGADAWAAFALAAVYAIGDEWHQSFVPGRTAQALDVVIDAIGAFAVLIYRLLR